MRSVKDIKELIKTDIRSELNNYVVDDLTIEELSEEEKEIFWREYDKILNRLLKVLN